ncbi:MAG TPA: hypothetical protein VHM88_24850 [Candidatus Acidoferrales bacterium]|jgi:hypothetical protein|nr:hypothetical protein [Candidatus Dormibacteraeota bacterium]HEX2715423.1 hypothetical protein [Candidatus Acidoferrales bacterium]
MRVSGGTAVHFTMLTFWQYAEVIAAFAGEDTSVANYYDFERDFLSELEPTVEHHDVFEVQQRAWCRPPRHALCSLEAVWR